MSRGRRVPTAKTDESVNEAIETFGKYGIVAVRRKRGGEIIAVKTATLGWIKPERYAQLKELKDAYPLLTKVVEGGYRFKAAVYAYELQSPEILGSDVSVPMGVVIVGAAWSFYLIDTAASVAAQAESPPDEATAAKFQSYAMLDLACLLLPFGELWLLWRLSKLVSGLGSAIASSPGSVSPIFGIIQAWEGLEEGQMTWQNVVDFLSPGADIAQGVASLAHSLGL